ncbi:TPA: 50S ribosomal protein L25 [Candidatus Gracilibacteria bacterium]|nr:50S ribosomal protein L25 [Candidatus Peregrinibacteria bacterium]HIQ56804.1 50S ribosomal protein L25 [Candidatus Gracilibacteria bacterium]HIQ57550.1 50S ribosomal protein L25 [Candidatus Gracilibacteria bacterium]
MNEVTTISVQTRDINDRPRDIRAEGLIPAVLYGFDIESTPIQFDYQIFRKAFRVTGRSTVMTLELNGKNISTLIKDIQYNPLTDEFDHVDFLAVDDNAPVKTRIKIRTEGMSPAEKNLQSLISKPTTSIEVSCIPRLLKKDITVDLGVLVNFFDKVTVADLPISSEEGIEVLTNPKAVIIQANTPKGGIDASNNAKDTEKV